MRLIRFEGGAFAENGYLVVSGGGDRAVAVDPGAAAPGMVDWLAREGVSLDAILLTHAHLDHVEGIPSIRDHAPEAPIHLHPSDRPLYDAAPEQASAFGMPVPVLPPPDVELAPGTELDFGDDLRFSVRFAPGHAPGHVLFVHEPSGTAWVGDVVFQGSIGRTDLPGGSLEVLMESIRREILSLPDETRLLPGHGPETTVGRERLTNPFLTGAAFG